MGSYLLTTILSARYNTRLSTQVQKTDLQVFGSGNSYSAEAVQAGNPNKNGDSEGCVTCLLDPVLEEERY
jgi:hypothetical protein